jgi:hypothetical protein
VRPRGVLGEGLAEVECHGNASGGA